MTIKAWDEMGLAEQDMKRQWDEGSVVEGAYSLTSLWRASGKPLNKLPDMWVFVAAAPLVLGIKRYFENLEKSAMDRGRIVDDIEPRRSELVFWAVPPGSPCPEESIQPGDLMGTYLAAKAYAMFLDADEF